MGKEQAVTYSSPSVIPQDFQDKDGLQRLGPLASAAWSHPPQEATQWLRAKGTVVESPEACRVNIWGWVSNARSVQVSPLDWHQLKTGKHTGHIL